MLCGCQFTLPNATESKSFEGTRWSLLASGAVPSECKQMPDVSLLHPSFSDGCHMDGRGSTRKIDIIPLLYRRSFLVIAFVCLWVSWFVISPRPWFRGWHMMCFWGNPRDSSLLTKFCCYLRSVWRGGKQNAIAAVNFTSLFSLKKADSFWAHEEKRFGGNDATFSSWNCLKPRCILMHSKSITLTGSTSD
jgi:hypothetical protein